MSIPFSPLDNPALWSGNTRLLDLDNSKLRLRAMHITQLATSDIQKAVRIHDFIKSLPFGCPTTGGHTNAAAVLKSGRGDCHSKGTLFVALLRVSGIAARLRGSAWAIFQRRPDQLAADRFWR